MSNKLTGKAFTDVPGMGRLRTKHQSAKLSFGGRPREGQSSDVGAAGYQEGEFQYPYVETTLMHGADIDIEVLRNADNLTVTHTTDTGVVHVLQQAWVKDILELNGNGELPVKFEGMRVDKVS